MYPSRPRLGLRLAGERRSDSIRTIRAVIDAFASAAIDAIMPAVALVEGQAVDFPALASAPSPLERSIWSGDDSNENARSSLDARVRCGAGARHCDRRVYAEVETDQTRHVSSMLP